MELLELHMYPEFLDICCDVLNSHWSRSYAARAHSLSKSNSNLPVSLILVQRTDAGAEFIGHAKLSRVAGDPKSCFVESVIVKPEKRGHGLGKLLMNLIEDYARRKGFMQCHLSTQDKEEFYRHIGYVDSTPVCAISRVLEVIGSPCKLLGNNNHAPVMNGTAKAQQLHGSENNHGDCTAPPPSVPPPPPPLPDTNMSPHNNQPTRTKLVWMKKVLL